jgi:hypothetical protein
VVLATLMPLWRLVLLRGLMLLRRRLALRLRHRLLALWHWLRTRLLRLRPLLLRLLLRTRLLLHRLRATLLLYRCVLRLHRRSRPEMPVGVAAVIARIARHRALLRLRGRPALRHRAGSG